MEIEKLHEKLEQIYYWDARVLYLSCEYFGDEVILVHENDENHYAVYSFLECYKSDISHIIEYQKDIPYKKLTKPQIPFFMQEVDIKKENDLYIFNINAFPLYLEIKCKEIKIERVKQKEIGNYINKNSII